MVEEVGTFPFEARVSNTAAQLKPGTFARVHIETTRTEPVLTVPFGAIQYRYGVNRLFVVADDHLVIRELNLGDREKDRVEVSSGVKAGEPIALGDVERFADGMKVAVTKVAKATK